MKRVAIFAAVMLALAGPAGACDDNSTVNAINQQTDAIKEQTEALKKIERDRQVEHNIDRRFPVRPPTNAPLF